MKKKIERLSNILVSILRERGLVGRLKEYRLFSRWEDIVGDTIARHARPVSVRGNRLYLAVDSSAWSQQLSQLKPELLEKINLNLGREAVKDITFRLGGMERTEWHRPAQPPRTASLSPEEEARIESYVQVLKDEDLRKSVRRLIKKDMLLKKEKR